MSEIRALKQTVESEFRCTARYITTETVKYVEDGGDFSRAVHVYDLTGGPASRAYVWQIEDSVGEDPHYRCVLGEPPINSALDAVRITLKSVKKKMMDEL